MLLPDTHLRSPERRLEFGVLETDHCLVHRQGSGDETDPDPNPQRQTGEIRRRAGHDLSIYTYLADVEYQVQAHFDWNYHRQDLTHDRNENKHFFVAKRMIERVVRRYVFLGTRECQAYVEPCAFGEGAGFYDDYGQLSFGLMFHGFDYPDELGKDELHARFWHPNMVNGVVEFIRPDDCDPNLVKFVREMTHPPRRTPSACWRKVCWKATGKERHKMSWMQKLYETYNNCAGQIGYSNNAKERPLLPICHITTQAHIEIAIDGAGNFLRARLITDKSEVSTIIPSTESSASRAGS